MSDAEKFETIMTLVVMLPLIVWALDFVIGSIWRREHDDLGKG